MEEEIVREIKRSGILKEDENFIKVLINICKYYKIYEVEKIVEYIKNIIKF